MDETADEGVGETSCSAIQRVTISGSNNAISTPSPAECSNGANCDIVMWNYYNVYANDEANCSGAQCAYSLLYLQPAANLGCSLGTPAAAGFGNSSITQHGTSGSKSYTYIEEVYSNNCMTFSTATTTSGNATLSSSNYNTVAMATVTGALWYRLSTAGPGNASGWPSTVYGSGSVDAVASSGGGTILYPANIYEAGSAGTVNDTSTEGMGLEAMGTIPICPSQAPGGSWLTASCGIQSDVTGTVNTSGASVTWQTGTKFTTTWSGGLVINGVVYPISSCSSTTSCTLTQSAGTQTGATYHYGIYSGVNNTTLTALSTSGPTAPTATTLGLFQHASIMGRSGTWHEWGQETVFGSNVVWSMGTLTDTMCNVNKANEYPSSGSYLNCPGHGLMGLTHETLGTGGSNVLYPNPGSDPNFSQLCIALDSSFPAHSSGLSLVSYCGAGTSTTFSAVDANGTDSYDQHQTWGPTATYGSDAAPYQVAIETSSGANGNSFQYPSYVGRGLALEIYDMMPDASFRRYAHHRASGYPYYTTTPCKNLPQGCEQLNWVSFSTESDDGHWGMFNSDMNGGLGCSPTEIFSITGFTAPNQITISANNSNTGQAPTQGQVGTVVGSAGVTGLNGQWAASAVTGSNPYTVTLTGASLSGSLTTAGTWQNCTFNANGQVTGPVPSNTCGTSGTAACQYGQSRTDVWLVRKQ